MATSLPPLVSSSPPIPRTRLIGRETERATARAYLLDEAVPLLTLNGPGGVGKTRLALAVARELDQHFADGVAWIDLAPLSDASLVPATVVAALGVVPDPNQPIASELARVLRPRQTLLLLDNCEHVLAATADLVGVLLAACPALQVVATSRAPLHLRGEQEMLVEPLPLPHAAANVPLAALERNDAVRLFIERTRTVHPAFAFDDRNAGAVAEICRQLDGLPLAIELAAARMKILSPEALLTQMRDRLRLLSGGPRDLPARQRTIRDTIAWSYELLSPPEQALFRRLAVFAGGFTLEAAQAVAGNGAKTGLAIEDGVAALVDQSMARRMERQGEPRFMMLETVRTFGLERLATSGEEELVRRAHLACLVERAEAYYAARFYPAEHPTVDQNDLLDRLEADHANIRAALSWALEHDAETALHLAGTLLWFWEFKNHVSEGRAWLEAVLALPEAAEPSPARARALQATSNLARIQGEIALMVRLREEGLAVRRALGDLRLVASAAWNLGEALGEMGDLARAERPLAEGLALARELRHEYVIIGALADLGRLAVEQGDLDRAEVCLTESLERAREGRNQIRAADNLTHLGRAARLGGKLDKAVGLLEEAVALQRSLQDHWGACFALRELARIAAERGDTAQATMLLLAGLVLLEEIRDRRGIAAGLETAALLIGSSRPAEAARLLGTAAALRETIGAPLRPSERTEHERTVEATRIALGEEAFGTAWAEGQRTELEAALPLVTTLLVERARLSDQAGDEARPPRAERTASGRALQAREDPSGSQNDLPIGFDLTRREREVLTLLCQRFTDPEIAAHLFISPSTASRHVANIYSKLGVSSRREAAAVATRHALA